MTPGRAHTTRHIGLALVLAASLAAGAGLASAGSTHAAGYAGTWKVSLSARCANSPQNARICARLFGPIKGIGVRGTTLTEQLAVSVSVAANGHYTGSGVGTITESAPGARARGCPSIKTFGLHLFNGSCTIVETYKGHIAGNPHGFPEFHGETYALKFNGTYAGTFKSSNSGLPDPARAGTYGAAWAASVAGLKSAPAGFSFREVVSR